MLFVFVLFFFVSLIIRKSRLKIFNSEKLKWRTAEKVCVLRTKTSFSKFLQVKNFTFSPYLLSISSLLFFLFLFHRRRITKRIIKNATTPTIT